MSIRPGSHLYDLNVPQKQKILITGATGLFGPHLVRAFSALGEVIELGRMTGTILCDLTENNQTNAAVSSISPSLTIHCAGLTNVDACETSPDEAERQNRLATANLVSALPKRSRLLFISTDQVYPNTAGPHKEGTECPINQYGKSKLAGEHEALKHRNSVAVRTNMFGPSLTPGRLSLSDFIIHNLTGNTPTTLFRDVLFSPLHFHTITEYLKTLAISGYVGACNLGSRNGITKSEFGLAIAAHKKLALENVTIIHSNQLSGRAPRPQDLRMDVSRVEKIIGKSMPATLEEIKKL